MDEHLYSNKCTIINTNNVNIAIVIKMIVVVATLRSELTVVETT